MPSSPFPITATETNEMITQMQSLMDDLYQNRLGGACVGDVFMVDDDDIFKLKYLAIGGLQKIAGSLAILPNTSKGIDCDRNGIFVVLEADKGLAFNGTSGIYVKLKTDNGLAVDTNGLYVKLKSGGGISVDSNGLYLTSVTAIRGTFTNTDLAAGILTITHNKGLSAPYPVSVSIFNNTAVQVATGTITGLTNTCTVDLSAHGAIAGTWGYIVL